MTFIITSPADTAHYSEYMMTISLSLSKQHLCCQYSAILPPYCRPHHCHGDCISYSIACVYVCVLELNSGHNRQTDIESDRGYDLTQQDVQTVAPCFSLVSESSFAFVHVIVCLTSDLGETL